MGKKHKGPIATREKAIERFRKTIEDYAYASIKRCQKVAQRKMDEMMALYPYEAYSEYIRIICYRYRAYKSNSYLWDECQSCAFIAYWYSIGRCAVSGYEGDHVNNYIKKLIRIYVRCKVAQYNLENGYVSWNDAVENAYNKTNDVE